MPTIQINDEVLNFDNIFYCNSEIGSDSNNGLTETTPVKTIQAAINKTTTAKTAIVLSPNSIFSGAVPNNGLVNIPSGKQITFIGKIHENDMSSMPIIRSTDNNCIANSSSEVTFINIRIESFGNTSTGYYVNYATLIHQTVEGCISNFYNCYLKPYGIIFMSGSIVNTYNSIIEYNSHNFISEIFSYTTGGPFPGAKTFYNSIILGEMTCRTSNTSDTGVFYNSIVPTANLTYHDFSDTTNKRIATSLTTINNDFSINLDRSYWKNQGLDENGHIVDIGIYGGKYGFKDPDMFTHFFLHNGEHKVYDTNTSSWSSPIGTNTPTEQNFLDYGMRDLSVAFNNINSLTPVTQSLTIKTFCKEAVASPTSSITAIPRSTTVYMNSISLSDTQSIQGLTLTATNSNDSTLKIMVSPDNTNWYVYKESTWSTIDPTTISQNGMTIDQTNAINNNIDTILISPEKRLYFAFNLNLNELNDSLNIDKISFVLTLKGTYKQQLLDKSYSVYYNNDKLQVHVLEPGTYKVNY